MKRYFMTLCLAMVAGAIFQGAQAQTVKACPYSLESPITVPKGVTMTCSCAAVASSGSPIWGSFIYSTDSSICKAAVFEGVIPAKGGTVTVKTLGLKPFFLGSKGMSNILTLAWPLPWNAFQFSTPAKHIGKVEAVTPDGRGGAYVSGYTCLERSNESQKVLLTVYNHEWDGTGYDAPLAAGVADLPSNPEVSLLCKTVAANHRFRMYINHEQLTRYGKDSAGTIFGNIGTYINVYSYSTGQPPTNDLQGLYITMALNGATDSGPHFNKLLDQSDKFLIKWYPTLAELDPRYVGPVLVEGRGSVGAVRTNAFNDTEILGWACIRDFADSVIVNAYVNGQLIGRALANKSSEAAVGVVCNSGGTAHRYTIVVRQFSVPSQALNTNVIVQEDATQRTLNQSGQFALPASAFKNL